MSYLFRILFWGVILAVGSQTGFSIYKMQAKMRELALKQVSEPWPTLEPAPHVDHHTPYHSKGIWKKKNPSLNKTLSNSLELYDEIYSSVKRH